MISKRALLLTAAILVVLLACAECQLTFSTGWGKRAGGVGNNGGPVAGAGGFFDASSGNCKTTNDMLLEIFRFVQTEAQLFVDCKQRE